MKRPFAPRAVGRWSQNRHAGLDEPGVLDVHVIAEERRLALRPWCFAGRCLSARSTPGGASARRARISRPRSRTPRSSRSRTGTAARSCPGRSGSNGRDRRRREWRTRGGSPPSANHDRIQLEPVPKKLGTPVALVDGLVPRLARLVEDREPVALRVVRPLRRERSPGRTSTSRFGSGPARRRRRRPRRRA